MRIILFRRVFMDNILELKNFLIQLIEKNKMGLTRDEAKEIFYRFRSKAPKTPPEDQKETPSGGSGAGYDPNVHQKLEVLMGYMQDTSKKLDRIENDLVHLKSQVEKILQKI